MADAAVGNWQIAISKTHGIGWGSVGAASDAAQPIAICSHLLIAFWLVSDAHDLDLRQLSVPVRGDMLKRQAEVAGLTGGERSAIDGAIIYVRDALQENIH